MPSTLKNHSTLIQAVRKILFQLVPNKFVFFLRVTELFEFRTCKGLTSQFEDEESSFRDNICG